MNCLQTDSSLKLAQMQPDSATDIIRSILRPYMMITNVEYWIVFE